MNDFRQWWQHIPEHLDPVIISIGSFKLQYYGLMYIVAFALTYGLVAYRLKREDRFQVTQEQVQALITYMMLGVIVGGRLGYVIFYNADYFLENPLEIILPFDFSEGIRFTGITGMSFHGGLIFVILFAWLYCRKNRISFLDMADLFIPAIPLGYTFGRLGNFINGELLRPNHHCPHRHDVPFGAWKFPPPPSQLYEAFFEGILLFALLWSLKSRFRMPGAMLALYLIGYGLVRFFIEYFRQPDAHIGFVFSRFQWASYCVWP